MRRPSILKVILFFSLINLTSFIHGQENTIPDTPVTNSAKKAKPYKILTNGKQITIQSKENIKSVMVWTSNGHRFIEQKDINEPTYKFNVTVNVKIFFLLFETVDGKRFTEKIGVQ